MPARSCVAAPLTFRHSQVGDHCFIHFSRLSTSCFFVAPSRSGATCHKTNASRTEKRAGRFRLAYPSETAQPCIQQHLPAVRSANSLPSLITSDLRSKVARAGPKVKPGQRWGNPPSRLACFWMAVSTFHLRFIDKSGDDHSSLEGLGLWPSLADGQRGATRNIFRSGLEDCPLRQR